MTRIIDADTHFMEPDDVYVAHAGPRERELALRVERDERGWPWLVHRGVRLYELDEHVPGQVDAVGERRRRRASGARWEPVSPIPDPWDAAARIATLEANGVDGSIVYPNLGLGWEDALRDDVPSLRANLGAYNTWLLERAPDYADRLFPAAHLSLRDLDWFEREAERCARGGLRLAMLAAQPIDGKSLAHPDFDRVWATFQDLRMGVAFHVSSRELPLAKAWYALDPERQNQLLDMVFLYLSPAVAVTALIVHGVLERFPGLRIGITELSAGWVPGYLLHLDGAYQFYERQNGAPLTPLAMRPSDYFRRQVRVNAFPLEGAAQLMTLTGGGQVFMWGSDYPHAEGMPRPSWSDYRKVQPRDMTPAEQRSLAGTNATFLLGETPAS